jgi:hypothetical protein
MVYYPKCSSRVARGPLPLPGLAIYRPGSWVIHSDASKLATDQQLCLRLIG